MEQYNPKNPDRFKQVELPPEPPIELNIVPLSKGQSTIKEGDFASKNFKPGRSGYRFREDGTMEALNIVASNIQTYEATVSANGGDYTTITKALNDGKKRIFIRAGTYTEDITITTGDVLLKGENKESAIINGRIIIGPASNDVYDIGTVSTTAGSTIITGSGTAWLTNVATGQSISLPVINPQNMLKYKIKSVDSNTQLTLEQPFPATMAVGTNYVVYKHLANFTVSDLTIKDTRGGGHILSFKYSRDIIVSNCIIYNRSTSATNNLTPLAITSGCVNVQINNVTCGGKTDLTNFAFAVYHGGSQTQSYSERVNENVSITNCTGMSRAGFVIDWVRGCHISNCYFEQASNVSMVQQTTGARGITTGVSISNCTFHFGALGVDIPDFGVEVVGCTFNSISITNLTSMGAQNITLSHCTFIGNTIYGVSEVVINGRDVVFVGNIVNGNVTNGVRLTSNASRSIVNGNSIRENGGTGILVDAGATSNIITSNASLGNSTAQYTDNGTTTTAANNVVA